MYAIVFSRQTVECSTANLYYWVRVAKRRVLVKPAGKVVVGVLDPVLRYL